MNYLIGHLIGDFLLQNDWMAQGKKRNSWICAVHVLVYSLCVLACTGWPPELFFVVAIPHFLIDRWQFVPWYMRLIGQPAFMQPPLAPWSLIVVDNSWHLVCLFLTQHVSTTWS